MRLYATSALGSIASNIDENIKIIIENGAVQQLLYRLEILSKHPNADVYYYQVVTNTMANLCNRQPPPDMMYQSYLPLLAKQIQHTDSVIVYNSCRSLYNLIKGKSLEVKERNRCNIAIQSCRSDDVIQHLMDDGIIPRLAELLTCDILVITILVLQTINAIVSISRQQVQSLLVTYPFLPVFKKLLQHQRLEVQRETARVIESIIIIAPQYIQTILDQNIIPSFIHMAMYGDNQAQMLGVNIIEIIIHSGDNLQVAQLKSMGVIECFCQLLFLNNIANEHEEKIAAMSLISLVNILSKNYHPDAEILIREILLWKIQKLQFHSRESISKPAKMLTYQLNNFTKSDRNEVEEKGVQVKDVRCKKTQNHVMQDKTVPVKEIQVKEVPVTEVHVKEVQVREVQAIEVKVNEVKVKEVQDKKAQGREVQDKQVPIEMIQEEEIQYKDLQFVELDGQIWCLWG